jgi:hypothetical protein
VVGVGEVVGVVPANLLMRVVLVMVLVLNPRPLLVVGPEQVVTGLPEEVVGLLRHRREEIVLLMVQAGVAGHTLILLLPLLEVMGVQDSS